MLTQRENDEFVMKQLEYEQKKQEKIRRKQNEKIIIERKEFEKNATFRPHLVATKKSKSPTQGRSQLPFRQNISPANSGRTLK